MNRIKRRHIVLSALLAAIGVASFFYLRDDQSRDGAVIRPYVAEGDYRPLVELINANKFMLSNDPNFSPERMLTRMAPKEEPHRRGELKIDVADARGDLAGFVAYYKKSREHGFIWFLAVDKNFRGRGFGEKLMRNAIGYFKEQGSSYITIATRLMNKPAISLYQKLGFVETSRDEKQGIIKLMKRF